ncbi:hypothetical protein [Enterococcus sp. LJL90]
MSIKIMKRTAKATHLLCPKCKKVVSGNHLNCVYCGLNIFEGESIEYEYDTQICEKCGAGQAGNFRNYCDNCGDKLIG